jgi:hypothetical protein
MKQLGLIYPVIAANNLLLKFLIKRVVLRYEGNQIVVASTGSDFNQFLLNFKGL